MTESDGRTSRQMRFVSSDGRIEVLWVQPESGSSYRVLNVPVWLYGISVGTLVEGRPSEEAERLEFVRVLEEARGGTIRLAVHERGPAASELYLRRLLPECEIAGLGVGPATFFDPTMVAFHLHEWEEDHPSILAYLEELRGEGVVRAWEVGDPVRAIVPNPRSTAPGEELVHPRPSGAMRLQHY